MIQHIYEILIFKKITVMSELDRKKLPTLISSKM